MKQHQSLQKDWFRLFVIVLAGGGLLLFFLLHQLIDGHWIHFSRARFFVLVASCSLALIAVFYLQRYLVVWLGWIIFLLITIIIVLNDGINDQFLDHQEVSTKFARHTQLLHRELVSIRNSINCTANEYCSNEILTSPGTRSKRRAIDEAGIERSEPDFAAAGLSQILRQDLMDLTLAANKLRQDHNRLPSRAYEFEVSKSPILHKVEFPYNIKNRGVALENTGDNIIINPRLIVNGQRDWFNTDSILDDILTPGMDDRAKAVAIWRFLVDNRYHGYPLASEADNVLELHDPIRFLNVYGYGFCDDAATNYMVLAEQAGLPARVWGLEGHVVAEAYYDGDWHMFDPDGEIYYLDEDEENISSVKTLSNRPDIIRRYPAPNPIISRYPDPKAEMDKRVSIYTTTYDNKVNEWYRENSEAAHIMSFILRPGESLTRSHENWGLYFANRTFVEPDQYGNGRFIFQPVFRDGLFKKGAELVDNVISRQRNDGWELLSTTLDDSPEPGILIYQFDSPYPFLDARVFVAGTGSLGLAFSRTGNEWTDIKWRKRKYPGRFNGQNRFNEGVELGGLFPNGYGRPLYKYFIKVTFSGSLEKLVFHSDIQLAPQSLPQLRLGENVVVYRDDSNKTSRVRITFLYN